MISPQHCFHLPYVRGSVKSFALLSKTSVLNADETLPRFPSEEWQQPVLCVHAHSSCRKKGKMVLERKFSFSVEAWFMPSLSRVFPQCKPIISTSKNATIPQVLIFFLKKIYLKNRILMVLIKYDCILRPSLLFFVRFIYSHICVLCLCVHK